jgi:hypothetical protein
MTNLACAAFDDRPSRFPSNFWYVKNPKTSSSTLAGVFRSIAAHHAVIMLNPAETHMSVKKSGKYQAGGYKCNAKSLP